MRLARQKQHDQRLAPITGALCFMSLSTPYPQINAPFSVMLLALAWRTYAELCVLRQRLATVAICRQFGIGGGCHRIALSRVAHAGISSERIQSY